MGQFSFRERNSDTLVQNFETETLTSSSDISIVLSRRRRRSVEAVFRHFWLMTDWPSDFLTESRTNIASRLCLKAIQAIYIQCQDQVIDNHWHPLTTSGARRATNNHFVFRHVCRFSFPCSGRLRCTAVQIERASVMTQDERIPYVPLTSGSRCQAAVAFGAAVPKRENITASYQLRPENRWRR